MYSSIKKIIIKPKCFLIFVFQNLIANLDITYNVLIIGTRKDYDAVKNWNGIEINKDIKI
jgi:hypothetical protein